MPAHRKLSPDEILSELEKIVSLKEIRLPMPGFSAVETRYAQLERFINDLGSSGKPETQVQNLFDRLLEDVLGKTAVPEVNIGSGFVDYVLKDENSQPVLIELKPLFYLDDGVGILKAIPAKWERHQDQIRKYLFKNDYVILTDLRNAYLFNREAIGKFQPFFEEPFPDLLRRFRDSDNIWDAIRRVEDQGIRPDLDEQFFADLKKWHEYFQEVKMILPEGKTKRELIVLLLNKVIFIKTLEDYSLIDFRFLTDTYLRWKDRWEERDIVRFITNFFNEIEEFFGVHYDTELFKGLFWDYVDKDPTNVAKFRNTFEAMLGTGRWEKEFAQGLAHYNYRHIDEDVFGKAYETFIAEHRKDSGVYYTPRPLTVYMARKIVQDVFEPLVNGIIAALDKDHPNFELAETLMQQLYELRIIDPTSGSGSFLIKVLREIDLQYQRITEHTSWIEDTATESFDKQPKVFGETARFRDRHNIGPHKRLTLIAQQILRHIFAADIDERALDTAKTNMWKEAVKLRPRIYNYRRFRKEKIDHILPDLELNFACGDSLADLAIEKQIEILSREFKNEIVRLREIRQGYIANPFEQDRIVEAVTIRKAIRERLQRELPEIERPILIALEFFFAYFDRDGNPLPEETRGFNGSISNPPWDALKPVSKEYAHREYNYITKGSHDIVKFSEWFKNELNQNPSFANGWDEYKRHYAEYSNFLRMSYNHQGKGDPNFYKYFLERDIDLVKPNGIVAILIQSGFQTDVGCKELREFVLRENTLDEINSFENKGYDAEIKGELKRTKLFPDVHPQFKFSILLIEKRKSSDEAKFEGRFYLHHPDDLYNLEPVSYSVSEIDRFSPINLAIMEFRSERDREICERIRGEHPIMQELGYRFYTEIHMTNDSGLFIRANMKEARKLDSFPLFEGKMIHQFCSNFEEPRFFITRGKGEEQIRRKMASRLKRFGEAAEEADLTKFKLDLDDYRLGVRDVGSSTNERSILGSLIPKKCIRR